MRFSSKLDFNVGPLALHHFWPYSQHEDLSLLELIILEIALLQIAKEFLDCGL